MGGMVITEGRLGAALSAHDTCRRSERISLTNCYPDTDSYPSATCKVEPANVPGQSPSAKSAVQVRQRACDCACNCACEGCAWWGRDSPCMGCPRQSVLFTPCRRTTQSKTDERVACPRGSCLQPPPQELEEPGAGCGVVESTPYVAPTPVQVPANLPANWLTGVPIPVEVSLGSIGGSNDTSSARNTTSLYSDVL